MPKLTNTKIQKKVRIKPKEEKSQEWYDVKAIVIVLIFLLPPIGLYALYKGQLDKSVRLILTIIGIAMIVVFFKGIGKDKTEDKIVNTKKEKKAFDESSNESKLLAYNCAKGYVKQNIKSPSTAKFPGAFEKINHINHIGNNQYLINSWVDSQNNFGAMIRSKFSCKIIINGDIVSIENLTIE